MRTYPVEQEKVMNLFYRVYGWMAIALLITGVTAFGISNNSAWMNALITQPYLGLSCVIVQLAVAILFGMLLPRLSFTTALLLFIVYALLTGATLSIIFRAYTMSSIIQTSIVTAGMFLSAAVFGYFTKIDLSRFSSLVQMALWGLILALLTNIFFKSSGFSLFLSGVGVVLFTALTAYDVNMIKNYAQQVIETDGNYAKIALYAAFQLYLDFINLFLSLLNIMGRRRE